MKALIAFLIAGIVALPALAGEIASSIDPAQLDEKKRTSLGLYLAPADAARALEADPGIVFIDVRDPGEVAFIGHPAPADANIPLKTMSLVLNAEKGSYEMVANPGFLAAVDRLMAREGKGKADPVIVMCRSGSRSAAAADLLAEAGYRNVWSLVEGFEGDRDKETGARSVNGWRNAGLPSTQKLDPDFAWQAGN